MKKFLFIFMLFPLINSTAQKRISSNLEFGNTSLIQDEFDDEVEDDDGRGFHIGLNIGMYFANKKSAYLYDGLCSFDIEDNGNGIRCYTIEERLGINGGVFANTTYNDVINNLEQEYPGVTGIDVPSDSYPFNIRYQGAFVYGLNISYNFDDYQAIVFNSSIVNVKATDAFTLILFGVSPQPNQPDVRELFTIWGEESRFNFQLGWKQGWEINETSRWIIELGGAMMGARIEANKILVAGVEYDLILGGDNPAQLFQYQPRTQVGFGAFITPGLEFEFQDKLTAMLGCSFSRDHLKLENFDNTLWNSTIFLRVGF